ncbi:hypothetical protein BOTBODRAFT_50846 [Botryobasidium botryosum FD-172 SS1]|uniref:Zn(2)-C6 fungal-type domain-containing protein n=1 Tax=Botryobasidium botryosum (strain FD-172 SS1) TaxID=930990 RepID=A0A067NAI5_BOTB1|nr:hypothetical protein BOTBODRAFT_50846 [Botryobasidium botryosum FD-172 SS1]
MPAARTKKEESPSSEDGTKDSPTGLNKDGSDKPKRKRQSQSCDACRARKVRCARDNPDDSHQSCKHCIALGIKCTYDYQPKKRGPPNLYLRRLQEAAAAAAAANQQKNDPHGTADSLNGLSVLSGPGQLTLPISIPSSQTPTSNVSSPFLDPSLGGNGSSPLQSHLQSSRYPISGDTFGHQNNHAIQHHQSQRHHSFSHSVNTYDSSQMNGHGGRPRSNTISSHGGETNGLMADSSPSLLSTSSPPTMAEGYPSYPLYNWPAPSPFPPPMQKHAGSHSANSPPPSLAHYYRPRSLDEIAPREQLMLIIALFFDFVHPLTPCVHKPSFMTDLHSRREERDPLFFALVMSVVASTLVQVPRSYLPMDRPAVRRLAQNCSEASRHVTVASYDPPTSMHVVVRYLDTVYHFCEGHDATSHASFGEAAHIAVTLHMHEEASYEGLDPIESEIRRRTFWLLFGADKSMSILLGRPICLRDEDCTLHFPKEVDDEYITLNGILPQPPGKTAIICGLNYITRIFALLGEILVRIRVDKRSPPTGTFATARLDEVRNLHNSIMNVLAHAPVHLRLKPATPIGMSGSLSQGSGAGGVDYDYGGAGFRKATFAEVKDFFDNPNASRENASNPFLVMQANLYVTQQLVRFVIEQYRDELTTSIRAQSGDAAAETELQQRSWNSDDREAVASDLLNILHSIPIQSIATNGPSLVHKVRFVASTLLDAVRKAETAPASAARAHAYLWDFLSILSEIERNYLLDDDRDGAASGDSLMGN